MEYQLILIRYGEIGLKAKNSYVRFSQIRTIDGIRCIKRLGKLSPDMFNEIQKITGEALKLLPRGSHKRNQNRKE